MPLMLILFSIPSLIYLVVRKMRGDQLQNIFKDMGWQTSRSLYYLWGLGLLIVLGVLGQLAFQAIPGEILQDTNININAYQGMSLSLASFLLILFRESIYVALGEEIFFRGLLGGWLVRKFGFTLGNILQAAAFLLPHLLLFLISFSLWPILIVQTFAGWLLGWLRYRSDSILPGWVVHSLINTLGALVILR